MFIKSERDEKTQIQNTFIFNTGKILKCADFFYQYEVKLLFWSFLLNSWEDKSVYYDSIKPGWYKVDKTGEIIEITSNQNLVGSFLYLEEIKNFKNLAFDKIISDLFSIFDSKNDVFSISSISTFAETLNSDVLLKEEINITKKQIVKWRNNLVQHHNKKLYSSFGILPRTRKYSLLDNSKGDYVVKDDDIENCIMKYLSLIIKISNLYKINIKDYKYELEEMGLDKFNYLQIDRIKYFLRHNLSIYNIDKSLNHSESFLRLLESVKKFNSIHGIF